MAEDYRSMDYIHANYNVINETIDYNQETKYDITTPNYIIKKRPPRRPKLNNKIGAHGIKHIDNNNIALQNEEKLMQIAQIEQMIKQTGENFSLLYLNKSLLVDKLEYNSLIYDIPIKEKNSIVDKVFKKQNTKKVLNHENEKLNNTTINLGSISSYIAEKQDKYFYNRIKWIRNYNSNKNTSEKNELQQNCNNYTILEKEKIFKEKSKGKKRIFSKHLSIDVVNEILIIQDPIKPNIILGNIRINPRCNQNAYISLNNSEKDILIVGLQDRNRALEGDLVAIIINPSNKWCELSNDTFQKTGTVVSILKKVHPRTAVGFLKKQDVFVCLQPRDSRLPLVKIFAKTVPKNFYDNPNLFKETLFLCKIENWKKVAFAEGPIVQIIGNKGDLSVESKAILLEHNLFRKPFNDEQLEDLPSADYTLSKSDHLDREDLRETCIFTIDSEDTVVLDNAISCESLKNGNFEVGMHVSDVTHFLKAFSPLDKKIAEEAFSVYMVDNAYNILPEQLTAICSLYPNKDKLTFSVIFEITPEAEVVSYRFSKTVINSCCKLTGLQAQIMIDNSLYNWEEDVSLKIYGNYDYFSLIKRVNNLMKLAKQLRKKRLDAGALKGSDFHQRIFLDECTKLPVSYSFLEKRECNRIVMEFSILTNATVAKYLYEKFPNLMILAAYPKPSMHGLMKMQKLLAKFGISLDITSPESLNKNLQQIELDLQQKLSDKSEVAKYKMMVIYSLLQKCLQRENYTCFGIVKNKDDLKHYVLNAELYTRFKSPMRSYCACVIHRLLYASIKNEPLTSDWTSSYCTKVITRCNTKKYIGNLAENQNYMLFFTYMLDQRGSMDTIAIVVYANERSAEVILCNIGFKIRLYFSDTIEETLFEFKFEQDVPIIKLRWIDRKIDQIISTFSILNVRITKHPQFLKLQGVILPPENLTEIG